MVRAVESIGSDSSYLEFFGLARPPFARLTQSSEMFHTEQYSLLMAHLANATDQPDCLVVIRGANGSGKTTLLNRYIDSLGDDVSYATVDETCKGEKQFYCALLGQLGFSDITGTPRELHRIAKEFLVHRGMVGDPVLLMIDNAHLMHPTVLEQLRWVSAIKVEDRRVLSVVLAGNSDLAGIMDSPAMSRTRFRSHVRFTIRAYSEIEIADYILHRLALAGATDRVKFSNEVISLINRYTGGTPSLINMLCNAVLTDAHALKSCDISEELVRTVADNRRLLPHVVPLKGKGRRKTDPDFTIVCHEGQTEERITPRDATTREPVDPPAPGTQMSDLDANDLLAQISQLSVELGELRTDRMRALQDIGRRNLETSKLRENLNAQSAQTEKFASDLADKTDEIEQLNQALSDARLALQENEKTSLKLAADLEQAMRAQRAAEIESANAGAKAEVLSQLTSELQATASGLTVDLKLADQRAVEIDVIKKDTAALEDEMAKQTDELLTLQCELDASDLAKDACISELQEVREMLAESQAQLTAIPTLIPLPRTDARDLAQFITSITAFEVIEGGKIRQVMELANDQSRIMIGRAEDSDLRLNSGFVSRHHALIYRTERGLQIEDLNSFNGTIVNSRKTNRCDLRADDVVAIGDFQIRPRSSSE